MNSVCTINYKIQLYQQMVWVVTMKTSIESGVGIPLGRCEDKNTDFKGESWSKGGDHVIEPGSFVYDVLRFELGFHLGKL